MLVTYARYLAITGDGTSDPGQVEEALADAQALLEDTLRRPLESGERTERLRVLDGLVYPAATPITDAGDLTVEGDALTGASPSSLLGGVFDSTDHATVTYTGGFTADTVPACIERDIAWAAHGLVRPLVASGVPVGATSVRLGDAAVTFAKPASGGVQVGWSPQTLRYRRRLP